MLKKLDIIILFICINIENKTIFERLGSNKSIQPEETNTYVTKKYRDREST